MNQEGIRQQMLGQLLMVQTNGPATDKYGLCAVLEKSMAFAYGNVHRELKALFESWPLYSGDPTFPVPKEGVDPDLAYLYNEGSYWDKNTEYGRNRWALLEHCIVQLAKQTEE